MHKNFRNTWFRTGIDTNAYTEEKKIGCSTTSFSTSSGIGTEAYTNRSKGNSTPFSTSSSRSRKYSSAQISIIAHAIQSEHDAKSEYTSNQPDSHGLNSM
jgi:hypothetical protein